MQAEDFLQCRVDGSFRSGTIISDTNLLRIINHFMNRLYCALTSIILAKSMISQKNQEVKEEMMLFVVGASEETGRLLLEHLLDPGQKGIEYERNQKDC